ncbi:MAG: hypothetical protein WA208_06285 [Thermoanaerobaculia bacterium]
MSRAVLVVEGYADLRSAIVETLSRGDFECDAAGGADAAIEKLREHRYEAILLASRLPIRDDPVMRFLHAAQPDQLRKVIVMAEPEVDSADDDPRILLKPFNVEQLLAKMNARA